MPPLLRRVMSYAFFFFAILVIIGMLAAMGFPVATLAIIPIGFAFFYKIKHTVTGKPMPQDAFVQKVTSAGLDMVSRKLNDKQAPEQPNAQDVKHSVQKATVVMRWARLAASLPRQQRFNYSPFCIAQMASFQNRLLKKQC